MSTCMSRVCPHVDALSLLLAAALRRSACWRAHLHLYATPSYADCISSSVLLYFCSAQISKLEAHFQLHATLSYWQCRLYLALCLACNLQISMLEGAPSLHASSSYADSCSVLLYSASHRSASWRPTCMPPHLIKRAVLTVLALCLACNLQNSKLEGSLLLACHLNHADCISRSVLVPSADQQA
jgi:hypothetical protein